MKDILVVFLLSFLLNPTLSAKSKEIKPKFDDEKKVLEALKEGGYVIYLRHHATNKNEEDLDKKNLKNCKTQRNLSNEGREGSKHIGIAFKKLGIKLDKVITSPYCRCVDTANLAFGRYEIENDLHFSVGVNKKERVRRSESLKKMLNESPKEGLNTVIVSHTANLKEAVGIWPKPEGVMHIFQVKDGKRSYIGKINPKTWTELSEK